MNKIYYVSGSPELCAYNLEDAIRLAVLDFSMLDAENGNPKISFTPKEDGGIVRCYVKRFRYPEKRGEYTGVQQREIKTLPAPTKTTEYLTEVLNKRCERFGITWVGEPRA